MDGVTSTQVTGRVLTSDRIDGHNTFKQPEAVKPALFDGAAVKSDAVELVLPARSVTVLEIR
jgi:alpha-N-arabinofuranosidase